MTQTPITTITPNGPRCCTLQDEDFEAGAARIVAEDIVLDGYSTLQITVYHVRDRTDPEPDDDPEISDIVLLPQAAWETLVSMFVLRHPDAAARLVTRAQGWRR